MEQLEGNANCPPELILAIKNFNNRLTKSHTRSASSNKFSIWHLLREEIEPTIVKILGPKLFEEIAPQGFSECAMRDSKGLEDRCRHKARRYSGMVALSQGVCDIYGTLDFLITLIHFCNSRLPHTYSSKTGRRKLRTNLKHFPFCEFCDRLCEAEKARVSGVEPEYIERKTLSMRFCERHKPGPGVNGYRRDLNYRDAFHKKIAELEEALRNKTYTEGINELREIADDYCLQGHDCSHRRVFDPSCRNSLTQSNAEQPIVLYGILEVVYGAAKIGRPGQKHVGNNKQVHKAVLHRDIGDVGRPEVVRTDDVQIARVILVEKPKQGVAVCQVVQGAK